MSCQNLKMLDAASLTQLRCRRPVEDRVAISLLSLYEVSRNVWQSVVGVTASNTIQSGPPWSRFVTNNAEANCDGPMHNPCQNGKDTECILV